jgi:hypothetical protein
MKKMTLDILKQYDLNESRRRLYVEELRQTIMDCLSTGLSEEVQVLPTTGSEHRVLKRV